MFARNHRMSADSRYQAELEELREENAALKKRLAEKNRVIRQWENLLGYDGNPQPDNLGGHS